MLNYQKIRLMTKASVFEDKEKNRLFRMNRYFRSDYAAIYMIRTAIAVTAAAVCVVAVWALIHMETLLEQVDMEYFYSVGMSIAKYYLAALAVMLVISFAAAMVRYSRCADRMENYLSLLRRIEKISASERGEQEEKKPVRKLI